MKELQRNKLPKKFFMTLEEGLFVASNCANENRKPVFADGVWPLSIRGLQWQIIVERKANSRLCDVYRSKADFEEDYFKRKLSMMMLEDPKW